MEEVSYLPKAQARKIYRIAQDMEDKMVELRRERALEETRAGATNVTVTTNLAILPTISLGNPPLATLLKR